MCGGTVVSHSDISASSGLSPRVRGNRGQGRADHLHSGSIPACAGEPTPHWGLRRPSSVYPRVCGGTDLRMPLGVPVSGLSPRVRGTCWPANAKCWTVGLSPRVRGNHEVAVDDELAAGSIPACAGEPRSWLSSRPSESVYPRVCGGTDDITRSLVPVGGLSPRVRGNRARHVRHTARRRSIPACAGEPTSSTSTRSAQGVYPRVCGGTTS